jgi:hypothetical protein
LIGLEDPLAGISLDGCVTWKALAGPGLRDAGPSWTASSLAVLDLGAHAGGFREPFETVAARETLRAGFAGSVLRYALGAEVRGRRQAAGRDQSVARTAIHVGEEADGQLPCPAVQQAGLQVGMLAAPFDALGCPVVGAAERRGALQGCQDSTELTFVLGEEREARGRFFRGILQASEVLMTGPGFVGFELWRLPVGARAVLSASIIRGREICGCGGVRVAENRD